MRSPKSLILLPTLLCVLPAKATNLWTIASQGAGAAWTANIWRTNPAGTGTAFTPAAGNTYVLTSNGVAMGGATASTGNTRVRPPTSGTATFPGDSLTLLINTDIRWKTGAAGNAMNFPGVGGNPGLILQGGLLNGGDDGTFVVTGLIRVAQRSYISQGANGAGGGISQNRAINITGQLTGSGDLVIMNAGLTIPQLISASNIYSGQWIVQCGWLVGTTNSSLGTNNIIVDPNYVGYLADMSTGANPANSPAGPALFEPGYNLNSAGVLTLTNGGRMQLHQNCCFTAVTVEGVSVPAGTHLYSDLIANYNPNNNFAAGGLGSITIQPYGTPPLIIPQFISKPLPVTVFTNQTARFSASVLGDQLTYWWLKDGVQLSDVGNISGSTTPNLTISAVSGGDVAGYSIVVSNSAGVVTSTPPASLAVVSPSGGTDLAAVSTGAAFYFPLDELGDPFTNAYCFDEVGGKTGTYGTSAQNGFNGIVGPRPVDGFPGFSANNTALHSIPGLANSWATLPPLNLNTNALTITAWINSYGAQAANEGIVFCRSGSTVAGLVIGPSLNLGYNWNNNASTINFNSGIGLPANQWSFVALAISPTNATLYLINTNAFLAAVNTFTNPPQAFAGNTLLGDDIQDNTTFNRVFNGAIDSVSIYTSTFNINQVINLYAAASGVSNFPANIVVPPQPQTVYAGQSAFFSVQAAGPLLNYQWQAAAIGSGGPYTNLLNGSKFIGVTNANLTIINPGSSEALDYVVVVTNISGLTNTYFSPASLTVLPVGPPQAITMSCQQAAGNDWNLNGCWSDGNPAATSAAANPGSTYEVLPGALLRSPQNVSYAAFPTTNLAFGYVPQLTVDGNGVFIDNPGVGTPQGQIKFKANLTTPGTNYFPKLVMNGGQLDNAGNPSGPIVIQGEVDILTNTVIYVDAAGGSGRPFRIDAWLTGNSTASIEYHDFDNSLGAALNISGNTNSYRGTWNVVVGPLVGTGANALGTNSITVGPNGDLETTYNLNSSNATLTLNGKMFLHQNDTFGRMYVDSVPVPAGTYTFAQLTAAYPSHFPPTWTALFGVTNTSASGSITVKTTAPPLPITFNTGLGVATNADSSTGAAVTYSVTPSGGTPPFTYQWYVNGAAIAGATNSNFVYTGANGTNTIYVVVQNGGAPATNGPQTLVVSPVGPVITFADTNNWSLQGAGFLPVFSQDLAGSNMLTLTSDAINEAGSAYYKIGQYIGAFNTTFVYTPSSPNFGNLSNAADGITFCMQNSARAFAALGGNGGNLGYVGINNSAVLAFNIYAPNIVGIGFGSGGQAAPPFAPTDPVYVANGDPIGVGITWLGNVPTNGVLVPAPLQVVLTNLDTSDTFTTNLNVGNLITQIGDSVAYVGFTAATGGSSAQQQIDNFSFNFLAVPLLSASSSAGGSVTISWPKGVAASYHLQQSANPGGPWSNVGTTPTVVNGYNQVVVTAAGTQYYRLTSP